MQSISNNVTFVKNVLASQGESVVKVLKTSLSEHSFAVVCDRPESERYAGMLTEFDFASASPHAEYNRLGTILLTEDKFNTLTLLPEGNTLDLLEALGIEKTEHFDNWTAIAV